MTGTTISLPFSGARLQELRERRGWTQGDLAQQCGVNRSTVGKWEAGLHKPDPRVLPVLASVLDVDIDALLAPKKKAAR